MIATSVSTMKGHAYRYEPIPNEYFREPRWAPERLFDNEPIQGSLHDPCCGGGTIVSVALDRGLQATGSDIVTWDSARRKISENSTPRWTIWC
jgi:hypothetical protein